MNAAAKAIYKSDFFRGRLLDVRFSKPLSFLLLMWLILLISAFAMIYITNANRINISELQKLEKQNYQLQIQWGKLLLEQASLITPARVETLANEKLQMKRPESSDTNVLQERTKYHIN